MRKMLIFLFIMFCLCTNTYAASLSPQDLKFTAQGEGKFIYCNNDEAIWRKDLSDTSNPNSMYIMNNDDLKTGKYSLFISHFNHTEALDENRKMTEMGFDIEVDVQFVAKQDSVLKIQSVGFDTQKLQAFRENDSIIKSQSPWDLVDAWVDYKQIPIFTKDTGKKYYPRPFTPAEVTIHAGEEIWLSQFIENYSTVTFLKAVHILSDFEIINGSFDVNIAALKHNGILKDRSHHSKNAKRGIYYRDKQYKGIADTLPAVNTDLHFTIDDTVLTGTLLPVKVYNQYNPGGNAVTKWFTHINPQEDIWARNSAAESDMLSFQYYDEEKLNYYNNSIPTEEKDTVWVFDVFHSDTKESAGGIPNYLLSTVANNIGNGCNLGNYGVSTNYHVTIENNGDKIRYLNYKLNSSSTNLVLVKDKDNNVLQNYAVRKNAVGKRVEETMASIRLPPKQSTSFLIEVLLLPNYAGGMENSFEISDTNSKLEFYDTGNEKIETTYPFTGKEYYKWYDKKLYFSQDCINWKEKEMDHDAKIIFESNWNNYEIKYFDGVYTIRWNSYDEAPYFYLDVLDFCNRVYYLNENFQLLTTHYYEGYPSSIILLENQIVAAVGDRQYVTSLPKLEKTISVKLEDTFLQSDVNPIIEEGRTLVPVRALFEALGAEVNWSEETRTANIKMGSQTIAFTIDDPIANINGNMVKMDVPARQYQFRTLVPIRFFSENLGYDVAWDDVTKTVSITAKK